MRPLVSVVIPAHNPGQYIEPCIRSILRQTMARERFEVIFVDDGSTDGTAERLNRLAGEQQHVRVIHIPASGAPGRPRNVGLEAARGEYVQFLDADDELAPRALERLTRMARRERLGRRPREVRERDDVPAPGPVHAQPARDDARGDAGARRREHGPDEAVPDRPRCASASITFPEGWRQMEDQLFTLRAYLAARVISVLADEPCYFFNKREDEGHISAEPIDPAAHVAHLEQILDAIDAGVPDPSLRRRFVARFYRTEILARLSGPQVHGRAGAEPDQAVRGVPRPGPGPHPRGRPCGARRGRADPVAAPARRRPVRPARVRSPGRRLRAGRPGAERDLDERAPPHRVPRRAVARPRRAPADPRRARRRDVPRPRGRR